MILTETTFLIWLALHKELKKSIAFTNGCFDILHPGHIHLLEEAKKRADLLVVALNSDASVKFLKGQSRPVHNLQARMQVVAALKPVDVVISFDNVDPLNIVKTIRPDVLVKGSDYTESQIVGADFVRSYGGSVHIVDFLPGHSSTKSIERLKA